MASGLLVKLAHRLVRLAGGQAIQIVAVQDRDGIRAGFAGAQRVGIHLSVGLPRGHAVGADRGNAASEQQGRKRQSNAGD